MSHVMTEYLNILYNRVVLTSYVKHSKTALICAVLKILKLSNLHLINTILFFDIITLKISVFYISLQIA